MVNIPEELKVGGLTVEQKERANKAQDIVMREVSIMIIKSCIESGIPREHWKVILVLTATALSYLEIKGFVEFKDNVGEV